MTEQSVSFPLIPWSFPTESRRFFYMSHFLKKNHTFRIVLLNCINISDLTVNEFQFNVQYRLSSWFASITSWNDVLPEKNNLFLDKKHELPQVFWSTINAIKTAENRYSTSIFISPSNFVIIILHAKTALSHITISLTDEKLLIVFDKDCWILISFTGDFHLCV